MELEFNDLQGITAEIEMSARLPRRFRNSVRRMDAICPPTDPPEVEFDKLTVWVPWSKEPIVITSESVARAVVSPEAWAAAEEAEIDSELEDEAI